MLTASLPRLRQTLLGKPAAWTKSSSPPLLASVTMSARRARFASSGQYGGLYEMLENGLAEILTRL